MDDRSLEFWRKYSKAPDVLAVMPARIVGKAISSHPNQPVQITVETTLPDGTVLGLPLVFAGEEDAAHIPNTVVVDPNTGERSYPKPLDVFLLVVSRPKTEDVEAANVNVVDGDSDKDGDDGHGDGDNAGDISSDPPPPPPPPAQKQPPSSPGTPLPPPLKPSNAFAPSTPSTAASAAPSTPTTPGTQAPSKPQTMGSASDSTDKPKDQ